jgi:hypothetical protein
MYYLYYRLSTVDVGFFVLRKFLLELALASGYDAVPLITGQLENLQMGVNTALAAIAARKEQLSSDTYIRLFSLIQHINCDCGV